MTKKKSKGGRPQKIPREKLVELINDYIDNTEIPIIAEFAAKVGYARQHLYRMPELEDALAKLIDKKEYGLERLMLSGKPNVATGCIFSLKQLGWKDKHELEHSGKDGGPIEIHFDRAFKDV